jgi:hypothetical protein
LNHGSNPVAVRLEPKGNSPSPSPCIAERAQAAFPEVPSWEAVRMEAGRLGLAEWKARDWFDEMEGGGWLDHSRRPICKWQSVLARVCRKWDADGRPAGPATNAGTARNGTGPRSPRNFTTGEITP